MLSLALAQTRLTANAKTIAALTRSVADAQARWKPTPDDWSMLEVINHLYDEEREDFRQRVDYILHRPTEAWPPIEPSNWVTARQYNRRDWATSLEAFQHERQASLKWLAELNQPNWESAYPHPQLGTMRAGEMLSAWVAHDHLHLRQLNELHWQYLATQVPELSLNYAGEW